MHEILVLGDGSAPYLPPLKDVGEKDMAMLSPYLARPDPSSYEY